VTVIRPDTAPAPKVFQLPEELVGSTTFLLKRLGHAAKERASEAFERMGLHPYHYAILLVLGEGSRETQGAIADTLGYDRGQLVGLLDELEDRGLVERRRDPTDRRRHLVRLTPDGKRTLRQLRAVTRQIENEFLAPLTTEERTTLHALLLRLAEKHEPRCVPVTPTASS
jgi:MarR family transcriptional regulator, lower aerobic nicotinate degradation pathway regulator